VLAFLKEDPSGMTLAELAYSMDMPSAATAKTLQPLASKKQIRKRDQPYLLAS
jgi:DNA-binding IclR family transcriptional regulator